MSHDIDALMDAILIAKDEGVKLEKVKMRQKFYDEHNEIHKNYLARSIDNGTILGVPIEIDNFLTSEYELVYKTST